MPSTCEGLPLRVNGGVTVGLVSILGEAEEPVAVGKLRGPVIKALLELHSP